MNINGFDQINSQPSQGGQPTAEQMRNAAVQFEAILLMQLTSALNGSSDSDEEGLFGSDSGSGLAKQLFSEQMASVMAQSGGFGIADMMMQQFGGQNPLAGGIRPLSGAASTIKGIRESENTPIKSPLLDRKQGSYAVQPSNGNVPSDAGDPNEVQIISTFEDDLRANGVDESTQNLILDGRVVNSTRSRVAPNAPITEFERPVNTAPVEFQKPVEGRISSTFGSRFHPVDRRTKFHAGLDIAIPTGTQVSAAAEGTVTFAGVRGGYGNMVIVQHPDGRETRYAHLSSISVEAGDPVAKGQPIALSGSTGKSTGPHLHFEMRENGIPVDPNKVLSNVLRKFAER